MTDPIRAALEVAALAACDGAFDRPCSHPSLCADAGRCLNDIKREEYAAAIAAFLEALPEDTAYTMTPLPLELAAAVRRAAGGG